MFALLCGLWLRVNYFKDFKMNKFKIISFLILTSFSSYAFAGAAEQWNASPRQMTIADQGMRTRNGIGVENVRASNDMLNADITQRVTVDGSNATINTKVSIPANDAFYKNTAGYAKNILKGGLYGAAAGAAMGALLDGVDYVMDEGGRIQKKPNPNDPDPSKVACTSSNNNCNWSTDLYYYGNVPQVGYFSDPVAGANAVLRYNYPEYVSYGLRENGNCYDVKHPSFNITVGCYTRISNPNYLAGSTVPTSEPISVSDSQAEDAFFNWFKNNPGSVTDPVTTYIYSPKDSQGNALPKSPPGSDPSFGPNEITDEMMDNYMEHRDANMQNPYTTSIQDSTQTDTTQNPDGSTTTTTTNPDGSKTTTRTDTKTDPDTG